MLLTPGMSARDALLLCEEAEMLDLARSVRCPPVCSEPPEAGRLSDATRRAADDRAACGLCHLKTEKHFGIVRVDRAGADMDCGAQLRPECMPERCVSPPPATPMTVGTNNGGNIADELEDTELVQLKLGVVAAPAPLRQCYALMNPVGSTTLGTSQLRPPSYASPVTAVSQRCGLSRMKSAAGLAQATLNAPFEDFETIYTSGSRSRSAQSIKTPVFASSDSDGGSSSLQQTARVRHASPANKKKMSEKARGKMPIRTSRNSTYHQSVSPSLKRSLDFNEPNDPTVELPPPRWADGISLGGLGADEMEIAD